MKWQRRNAIKEECEQKAYRLTMKAKQLRKKKKKYFIHFSVKINLVKRKG